MHKTTTNSCVEIHCTVSAKVGEQPNNSGCILTSQSTFESIKNLTVEGFVVRANGAGEYGFQLYDESPHVGTYTRFANNVFDETNDHDISTKERNYYTEVVDNIFTHCDRHCFEIGQNGNIRSRPSTTDTAVFRGNIVNATRNGVTQRYNLNLLVENNDFRGVGGNAITSWPYWALYPFGDGWDDGRLMIPGTVGIDNGDADTLPNNGYTAAVPLRTTIRGNKFAGTARLRFTSRGVIDDKVLIQGNTGTITSCVRDSMDAQNPGTAAAHDNEQTTAPPQLDPASDIPC